MLLNAAGEARPTPTAFITVFNDRNCSQVPLRALYSLPTYISRGERERGVVGGGGGIVGIAFTCDYTVLLRARKGHVSQEINYGAYDVGVKARINFSSWSGERLNVWNFFLVFVNCKSLGIVRICCAAHCVRKLWRYFRVWRCVNSRCGLLITIGRPHM